MTMAMTYLVTGGAGFIGANLIRRLVFPGVRLLVLDNLSAGRRSDLAGLPVEFIQGDIRDISILDRAVAGVQAVIHLAAHTNVVESIKTPEFNFNNNVQGVALEAELPFGQAIQLGSGREISINQLVNLLRQVVGDEKLPPIRYAPPRQGEVLRNYVSITRAREYLAFAPVTDLRTGLEKTWEWFQEKGGQHHDP